MFWFKQECICLMIVALIFYVNFTYEIKQNRLIAKEELEQLSTEVSIIMDKHSIQMTEDCQNENEMIETTVITSEDVSRGNYKRMGVPNEASGEFKSYMPYDIFNTDSNQYQLQLKAYTDNNGLRKVGDDFCIAVGTGYSEVIGDRFEIILDSGFSFTGIVADIKADVHTDTTNKYHIKDGSIIEFIVDVNMLEDTAKKMGDISHIPAFSGSVIEIYKI